MTKAEIVEMILDLNKAYRHKQTAPFRAAHRSRLLRERRAYLEFTLDALTAPTDEERRIAKRAAGMARGVRR